MKAVIYARYSSDNQREESIENQIRICKEYADKHNHTIVAYFGNIRTPISVVSGQHNGNIRTL